MSAAPKKKKKRVHVRTADTSETADSTVRKKAKPPSFKVLKKAKPSICKAAEELVCPILQGLPVDPVTGPDVSQGMTLKGIISLHFGQRSHVLHCVRIALSFTCILSPSLPCHQGQIYERKEIEKYLEGKKDNGVVLSPVTKQPLESQTPVSYTHLRAHET